MPVNLGLQFYHVESGCQCKPILNAKRAKNISSNSKDENGYDSLSSHPQILLVAKSINN